jgi:hypothetical protein
MPADPYPFMQAMFAEAAASHGAGDPRAVWISR